MTDYARYSKFVHYLAFAYSFVIVYASLQPFSGWQSLDPNGVYFLWAKWPRYITRSDLVINVLAYIPWGFLLALIFRQKLLPAMSIMMAIFSCLILSWTLESIQMYLPSRIASNLDLLCNTLGGIIGAMLAMEFNRHTAWHNWLYEIRYRLFLPGGKIDLGLVLIALWFLAQLNPTIPLFGSTVSRLDAVPPPEPPDILLEATEVLLNLMGVGLFAIILLRLKLYARPIITLLFIAVLIIKGFAATTLLKASVLYQWVSPGVVFGLAVGFLLLIALARLRSSAHVYICSICLLSSTWMTLLTIRTEGVTGVADQFNWNYGHLLNFNGLTSTILLIWPFLAVLYLLTFAKLDQTNN